MRTFSRTNQFKKDVKRAEKRGKDKAKLKAMLERLIDGEPMPPEFKDHPLRGNFAGSRDCHIEPDWVLIYTLSEKDTRVCPLRDRTPPNAQPIHSTGRSHRFHT